MTVPFKIKYITLSLVMVCAFSFNSQVMARSLFDRPGALDVVRDAKPWLEKRGIEFEIVYTGEVFSSFAGGEKQTDSVVYLSDPGFDILPTRYLDNLDIKLTVDTGKAGLWDKGKIFIYALSNHGDDPSAFVGDIQFTSNIEANDTTRLFELWYEHSYLHGGMTVLVGLHDLNSDFYITEYGGLFLNRSFRIGPDMSLNLPLSIFNVTALGVRVKLKRSGNVTYLAAIYDGDPGDPNENSDGFNIIIDRGTEGFLTIAEVQTGHTGEEPGFSPNALRVGGWYHSGEFEDARARAGLIAEKKHSGNMGFYATADRTMLSRKSGRQLGLFAQAGFTLPGAQDRNEVLLYLGGGINLKSILEMRPDDVFGVAIAYARISDDFASAERQATGKSRTGETALEITYRAQIYPWLTAQPDYQAVINPGGRTDVTTAHIASLRFEILF